MLSGPLPDRARWRNVLMYRAGSDVQLGIEYNPLYPQVGPLVNWRIARETPGTPALILGTSSDRIGTPYGRAYYATLSKQISKTTGIYLGASYSTFENRILVPFGLNQRLGPQTVLTVFNDGVATHPMLTHDFKAFEASLIMVRARYPGINLSVGF